MPEATLPGDPLEPRFCDNAPHHISGSPRHLPPLRESVALTLNCARGLNQRTVQFRQKFSSIGKTRG